MLYPSLYTTLCLSCKGERDHHHSDIDALEIGYLRQATYRQDSKLLSCAVHVSIRKTSCMLDIW